MRNEKVVICKSTTETINKSRRLQTLLSITSLLEPIEVNFKNLLYQIYLKFFIERFWARCKVK